MKLLYLLAIVAFCSASCEERNELYSVESDSSQDSSLSDANAPRWVCYNPNSELHGQRCTEECMEPGNQHTFCWIPDMDAGL